MHVDWRQNSEREREGLMTRQILVISQRTVQDLEITMMYRDLTETT